MPFASSPREPAVIQLLDSTQIWKWPMLCPSLVPLCRGIQLLTLSIICKFHTSWYRPSAVYKLHLVYGVKSTELECSLSCGFATRIDVSAWVDVDVKGGTGRVDIPLPIVCSACLIMQIVFDFETLSSLHGALSWFHFTRLMLGMFSFSQKSFYNLHQPIATDSTLSAHTQCIISTLYEWLFCEKHTYQMHFSRYKCSQISANPKSHQQRKSLNRYKVLRRCGKSFENSEGTWWV